TIKVFYSFDFHYPNVYPIPVGSHRYQVTVTTKGGHSYTDFGSPNAIVEASLLIESLSHIPVSADPKTTWNLGTIQGGTTVNSIASSCSFRYEYRSTDEGEIQRMKKAFQETLEKHQKDGVTIQVENIGERPALGPIDRKALDAFTRKTEEVVRNVTGMEPVVTSLSSDSNIPLSMGILANTVGTIIGDGAHTKEEWIDISSLPTGMKVAVGLVSLYLS
ncbi:MAG: peptidase dimerization domain-containing protein, partial [Spirochaetales bacterium]|nr:peptidase dimerization domain-containing protein [Candidatus Physcosoma equi]